MSSAIDTSGVSKPAPLCVYQTNWEGATFGYAIPNLTAGKRYTVRLHFAETYWSSAGPCVFNVSLNGQQVLSNFDIVATAGARYRAEVEQFTTAADSNGRITIQFTSVVDQALLSGVEIL